MIATLKNGLSRGFGIEHTTIQFECATCGQGRAICVEVMPVSAGVFSGIG
jgi:hypothetical protein